MPATSAAASKTGLTIDRDAGTIRLVRDFAAPPPVIFDAWTKPEHVACWWDPAGERLAECDIDLRPGGAFRFVSRAHPQMPFTGVYREIQRPERLAFDALGSQGRVMLQGVGAGTRMVVEIECASPEHLEQFLKMGIDTGTAQTLDNLVAYVGQRSTAAASA
jgi:uncharacterized protein YndB with AHSA1/START domain